MTFPGRWRWIERSELRGRSIFHCPRARSCGQGGRRLWKPTRIGCGRSWGKPTWQALADCIATSRSKQQNRTASPSPNSTGPSPSCQAFAARPRIVAPNSTVAPLFRRSVRAYPVGYRARRSRPRPAVPSVRRGGLHPGLDQRTLHSRPSHRHHRHARPCGRPAADVSAVAFPAADRLLYPRRAPRSADAGPNG